MHRCLLVLLLLFGSVCPGAASRRLALEPPPPFSLPTQLFVASLPPGALVLLDGKAIGQTPADQTLSLPSATQQANVEVRLNGYLPQVLKVTLVRGVPQALNVHLRRPKVPRVNRRPADWPDYLRDYTPPAGLTWADYRVCAKDGMPQVLIPAGKFVMGTPRTEMFSSDDERPQREIFLSAFWMDLHEVTVAQYQRFCQGTGYSMLTECPSDRDHDPLNTNPRCPVVMMTWGEASAYARWAGRELPTEAQWERAARAGSSTVFPWGDTWDPTKANNNGQGPTPAGTYPPNAFGVYDLLGNVWELCRDGYDQDWYSRMPSSDPVNTGSEYYRVSRGGSWMFSARYLRVAGRCFGSPDSRSVNAGFRCTAADEAAVPARVCW